MVIDVTRVTMVQKEINLPTKDTHETHARFINNDGASPQRDRELENGHQNYRHRCQIGLYKILRCTKVYFEERKVEEKNSAKRGRNGKGFSPGIFRNLDCNSCVNNYLLHRLFYHTVTVCFSTFSYR